MKHFLIWSLAFLGMVPSVLGQVIEFGQPVLLDQSVNSKVEEISPMLSPDGANLFFVRALDPQNVGGDLGGMDIWVSGRDADGRWKASVNNLHGWNNEGNNAVIGIRADYKVVYLLDAYKNGKGIAFSERTGGYWSRPQFLTIDGVDRNDFVGYYMNPSFNVLLISMKGKRSVGEEDLFVSLKDSLGRWSPPQNLGSTINTPGFEISPFLSNDGKRLYFASDGHGGYGDADIFYSDRLYNSWQTWSEPKNLGKDINSAGFDAYFFLSGDSIAYFSSNRAGGLSDIYQVKVNELKDLPFADAQLISDEGRKNLLGSGAQNVFHFSYAETELPADQREVAWYIANQVKTYPDVSIHLAAFVAGKVAANSLAEKRIQSILSQLKMAGMNEARMTYSIQSVQVSSPRKDTVEVLLYR